MDSYLKRAKGLHIQATTILQDLDLVSILGKHGKVDLVGSYALELMSWEDIDVVVSSIPSYNSYLEVVGYLFDVEDVYSINLQDFRKSIHSDRPQGIYCGINYLVKPTTFWKIDVWFVPDSPAIQIVDSVRKRLTTENRNKILQIKNEMREKTLNGKQISGMEVYEAVLDKGIDNLEDFQQFLKAKNIEL